MYKHRRRHNNSNKKSAAHIIFKSARFRKFTRAVITAVIIISIITGGLLTGAVAGYVRSTAPITAEQLKVSIFKTFVYDSTGTHIISELTSAENRIWVDYDETPEYMRDAIISIEDERFDQHTGVDITGLVRAFIKKLFNPTSLMAGASTITQQVIKNITGEGQRSIQRKIQEQWRALLLEKQLDKWEILQLYMNVMTTGVNMYGVQIAAHTYFNKDVKNLSLAQCAVIAGITNNPAIYNPYTTKGRESAKNRKDDVLWKMLELGKITQAEYDTAIREDLVYFEKDTEDIYVTATGQQSYFVDQVVLDVKKDLVTKGMSESAALNKIYNSGLKIITTMDITVQNAVDEVYKNEANFPVTNPYGPHPQASVVVIEPMNGQVKALYGGYGEKEGNTLNRATQIQRPPGSSIKPLAVYAPAINEKLITSATMIDDAPVYMLGIEEGLYPENYEKTYNGLTVIRDAIRLSLNVVAAKVWRDILKADLSLKYLKSVGISREQRNVSLALGGLDIGVNPLQMAAAYVALANRGIYYQPVTYLRVYDSDGTVLLDRKSQKPAIVYSEATAYIMTEMMGDVCRNGTAYPYGLIWNGAGELIPTAGKTGTTSDNRDKWFVGYSANYVCATWYGYDNNAVIPEGAERNQALNLWNLVMTKIHAYLQPVEFEEPPGIERADICIRSGLLPGRYCLQDPLKVAIGKPEEAIRYGEVFLKGTAPTETCDVHLMVKVCQDSFDEYGRDLPPSSRCPRSSIVEKLLIRRKVPFIPVLAEDPLPADFMYDYFSTAECNVHGTYKSLINPLISAVKGSAKSSSASTASVTAHTTGSATSSASSTTAAPTAPSANSHAD